MNLIVFRFEALVGYVHIGVLTINGKSLISFRRSTIPGYEYFEVELFFITIYRR